MSRRAAPEANPVARSAKGSPVSRRAAPEANPVARSAKGGPASLDLRRLKLRHLSTVVEVARADSLTRAALALHVTVPAVSKTLREVRTMLGMELFELRHGTTQLTPQGEVFVAHARASLEAVRRGVAEAQQRVDGQNR